MATYIKSLKEDNGDIILPQTSADAVLASDDTTVQSKLDNYATVNKTTSSATTATNCVLKDASGNELHPTTDFTQVNGTVPTAKIASSAVTSAKLASSAVTTAKIADSAVTSAKIDWTTFTDSTAERIVGKTTSGAYIYEKAVSGSWSAESGTRWTNQVVSVNSRLIALTGWYSENEGVYACFGVPRYGGASLVSSSGGFSNASGVSIFIANIAGNTSSGTYYCTVRYIKI